MLFNSIEFFVFLAAVFPVYFLAHRFGPRGPVLVLLIASLIFYAWWRVQYLWLLLLSICFNYVIGRQLLGGAPKLSERTRDVLLAAGVATNLGLLFVFKYLDFFLRDVLRHDPLGKSFRSESRFIRLRRLRFWLTRAAAMSLPTIPCPTACS